MDADKLTLIDRSKVGEFSDEELLLLMQKDFTESDNHWSGKGYFDKFRRWEQMYNLNDPVPYFDSEIEGSVQAAGNFRANNFYPLVQVMCDTIHAIISDALFPSDDFFFMKPTEVTDNEYIREAARDFLQFECKPERTDLRRHFDTHLRQAIHFQWSVARVGYRCGGRNVMVATKTVKESLLDNLKGKAKDIIERMKDGDYKPKGKPAFEIQYKPDGDKRPDIEVINTFNSRPDPKALDFDDRARFFCYEAENPWTHYVTNLKTKANTYGLYDEAAINEWKDSIRSSQNPTEQEKTEEIVQKNIGSTNPTDDMVKVRVWANQYYEFVTDQNMSRVLRRRKKDGWDFSRMVYYPRLHRFEGYCVPERCEKLNIELNAIANSRRDNVNMIVDAVCLINKNLYDGAYQDARMYSGKMIPVDGPPNQAWHFERPPDGTQAATQEIQFVENWAQKSLGPGENQQGQYRTSGGRTATESEIVSVALQTRMSPIIKRIEREDLRWALKQIFKMDQLYLDEETQFTVMGPEGMSLRKMSPETLSTLGPDVDVTPIGSTVEQNRFYNRLEKLETVKIISTIPQSQQVVNWTRVIRALLESARFQGIDDLITNDPEQYQTIPPEYENIILQFEPIAIRDADDHEQHIQSHREFMASEDFASLNLQTQQVFAIHVQQHEEAIAEKAQTHPGPQAAPDIFQGVNTSNALSSNNPMSMSPMNMPTEAPEGVSL